MTDDTATPEEGRLPTPHLGHGPKARRAKARLDQELTWNAAAKRYTS